jgi:TPR repeat protein
MYSLEDFQKKINTPYHFAKMIYDLITSVEKKMIPLGGLGSATYYRTAAYGGDPRAQFILGVLYDLGYEVSRNLEKAFEWYLKSAMNGQPEGMFLTGLMCKHGVVAEVDEARASMFFNDAAKTGLAAAQLYAGRQSLFGKAEEVDYEKALSWFLKAADQGLAMAEEAAGAMYLAGLGVEADNKRAYEWFLRAANQDLDTSQHCLGDMFYHGDVPLDENNLSFEFISHLEYLNSPAHYRLGPSIAKRRQMHINLRNAFKWFSKAAELGNIKAMKKLGDMYLYGEGTPKDKLKSQEWTNRATETEKKKERR